MAEKKKPHPLRNLAIGAAATLGGLGVVTYVATRPNDHGRVTHNAPVDDDVSSNVGKKAPASFEAEANVDVRDLALTQETPPNVDGDPPLMQFTRQTLPAGKVDLKIDARQVFQLANITSKEGNLRALALPKNDGSTLILELQPTTKVRLVVHMGKDKEAAPAIEPGGKADFEFDRPVNWVKELGDKIEKNNATKGAVNTNAVRFFNNDLGGLVGNFAATLEQKRLPVDENAPADFKSGINSASKLNWDPYAQAKLEASLKSTREK